jgi:hypothetical protein
MVGDTAEGSGPCRERGRAILYWTQGELHGFVTWSRSCDSRLLKPYLFFSNIQSLIDCSREFIVIIIATKLVCMPILVPSRYYFLRKAEPIYWGNSKQPFIILDPSANNLVSPQLDMKDRVLIKFCLLRFHQQRCWTGITLIIKVMLPVCVVCVNQFFTF